MTGSKCKNCGSSELDVDPCRGDTVCTNCGTVLEDSVIVSEVQFEENAHGGASTIGQFVAADSSGGCRGFGNTFHSGAVKVSRDITLQNAKKGIQCIAQQLRLNQHCIDTAFNFYKMALARQLTRGRKNTHVLAACLYITCRIEGTPHLLIDFSDVLQICAFELGRTYLRLSQALSINVPSMDPCLYVLRFANKLDLGQKTHEVTMTALRIVQRMKRDSMHSGRRPSGICGAALLMSARLHGFNRTVSDMIKIVQVHETTLRKRLVEFGETPSSSLTLQEFMTVDLEEEQDPPSYKAARTKDRERLKVLGEGENAKQLAQLQSEIENQLFEKKKRSRYTSFASINEDDPDDMQEDEEEEVNRAILKSTLGVVESCLQESQKDDISVQPPKTTYLGPSTVSMGLDTYEGTSLPIKKFIPPEDGDLDLEGLNDDELDGYIMNKAESEKKNSLWFTLNSAYLKELKEKEEKAKKEKEEGKPDKKKRRVTTKKKQNASSSNPADAIEKILKEKKVSSKINYDVLKSLNTTFGDEDPPKPSHKEESPTLVEEVVVIPKPEKPPKAERKKIENPPEPPRKEELPSISRTEEPEVMEDDEEDEVELEGDGVISISQMLSKHHQDNDDDAYGYDDDDY